MSAELLNITIKHLSKITHLSADAQKVISEKQQYKTLDLEEIKAHAELLKETVGQAKSYKQRFLIK